jgi:parvulin-like peptidyl-prolyl isomerase
VKLLLLLSLLFNSFLLPQKLTSVIAGVGSKEITEKEFRLRYELSPFVSENSWNEDSLKKDFLYSLIAEKLWAEQAEQSGILNDENFRFYFNPVQDILLRDALFKEEIENKVKVYETDITNALFKYQFSLKAVMISSPDSALMFSFYEQLNSESIFDSLLTLHPSLNNGRKLLDINFGIIHDIEIEDLLYSLDVHQSTSPIRSELGWVIFRIIDKQFSPADLNDQKTIEDIKRVIRMRKTESRYKEYLHQLLKGKIVAPDEGLFLKTVNSIMKVIHSKTSEPASPDSEAIYVLNEKDYLTIRRSLGSELLNKELFKASGKKITMFDFLSSLAFKEFSVRQTDSAFVVNKLSSYLRIFIEESLITAEAYNKNLNHSLNLKSEIEMWRSNYLAHHLKVSFLDSVFVSEDDVYNYYLNDVLKDTSLNLVNVQIVSLADLEQIGNILNQLNEGKSFGEIIKVFGKTDPLADHKGETGLKPLMLLEDIGLMAQKLKEDEVYGPVKRNGKYTLIRVKDKQKPDDTLTISYESSRDVLRNQLRIKKLNEILSGKTMEFLSRTDFYIDREALKNIKTLDVRMFVHRLMGFGGRIAAVPVTDNWSEWIDEYEMEKNQLP